MRFDVLAPGDLGSIYQCFRGAFADYPAGIIVDRKGFESMIRQRGFDFALSIGAFEDEQLVGFILVGQEPVAFPGGGYDIATGVLPAHRGQRLTRRMFHFGLPVYRAAGLNRFLLEVICDNHPALRGYRALGFQTRRILKCFRMETFRPTAKNPAITLATETTADWPLFQSFWDAEPSWQNHREAVDRAMDERVLIVARADNRAVGYGIAMTANASIPQLAVSAQWRGRGIGSMLLARLIRDFTAPARVINVDEHLTEARAFLEKRGFTNHLDQYEMDVSLDKVPD